MRSVVLGLMLAGVVCASAQARGCPVAKTVIKVEAFKDGTYFDSDPQHPEWIGREYRVAWARSSVRPDAEHGGRLVGYEVLALKGHGDDLKIAQVRTIGTPPIYGDSWIGEHDTFGPLKTTMKTVDPNYRIAAGPMIGLAIRLKSCG